MTAPASTLGPPHRSQPRTSSRGDAVDEIGKYQFQVVAANIADAVLSVGGLIYDRAMAGWDVCVVLDGHADHAIDDRPARILGARVARRLSYPVNPRALPHPHLLAVATDVLVSSDAVRRHALAVDDHTELLLWGRHHPPTMNRTFVAVRHQLSAAAHVFKSQALIAGGAQMIPRADEALYSMA